MNHNLAQSPLIYGGYMIFSPAVFLFRIFMGLAQFDIIGWNSSLTLRGLHAKHY